MEEKHWIEWIELIADAQIYRQYLKAGDLSEATFVMEADEVEARAYCHLHVIWRN